MAEQLAIMFAILTLGLLAVSVASIITARGRSRISLWLDRGQVRPSQIEAAIQVLCGTVIFTSALTLPTRPTYLLGFLYTIVASIVIAFAVEKLRKAPDVEYRPSWYVGDGIPTWQTKRPWQFPRQISLGWLVTFTLLLCVSLAAFSVKFAANRVAQEKHDRAVQRIVALGGSVQQGTVSLAGCRIKDQDLLILTDVLGLRDLNLGATEISNAALRHIEKLKTLQMLNLSGTKVDDAGLASLAKLPRLRSLRLRQTSVTGTAFPLNKRKPLVSLDLSRCPLTREGLESLKGGTYHYLDLSQTPIDDSMLDEIKQLDGIRKLFIQQTNISADGAESIRSALGAKNVAL